MFIYLYMWMLAKPSGHVPLFRPSPKRRRAAEPPGAAPDGAGPFAGGSAAVSSRDHRSAGDGRKNGGSERW